MEKLCSRNSTTVTRYTCSQYYCSVVYIFNIFMALFVTEHHWKNLFWPCGDLNPRRRSLLIGILGTQPSHIQKKGCIKPRDKQHCLSRSFNVNFRIMTEAILVCNQYYFNRSLCINYIYSIIWHRTSLKTSFHVSTWNPSRWFLSTDMLSTRLSRIPKRIHQAQS